jgi:hypothetical protein
VVKEYTIVGGDMEQDLVHVAWDPGMVKEYTIVDGDMEEDLV